MTSGLTLLAGLIVLLAGGEFLVRGASALARTIGVSTFVVGLTVVAFGTSAPELAVNVAAALSNNGDLTFGNVVGSNIANIGLIIGLTALMKAFTVRRSIVSKEIPVMLAVTALGIVLALDTRFGRMDGAILLICFACFLFVTTRAALKDRNEDRFLTEATGEEESHPVMHWAPASLLTLAGLAGVLLGSDWTVQGATGVATAMGMSQAVIGLTIVALGTSLPELTTSLFAVRKGQAELAIGNVVGSNIFNLLFILGVSSGIRAVPVPRGGYVDLIAMAIFSVVLLPFAMSRQRLARHEGLVLLAGYLGYMAWRTFSTS